MNILVIGSGGREHALVKTLARNNSAGRRLQLFCAPGNDGIAPHAQCAAISVTGIHALADFAAEMNIDLTIVGGETSLAAGIVDEFEQRGLLIAGPRAAAARLESSKVFAKNFMARHNVPTARFRVADSVAGAREILRSGEFGAADNPVVVKADGLAGGKGVTVARSHAEAEQAAVELLNDAAPDSKGISPPRVLIEEALEGREASLLLFADGRDYKLMPAARDHKRVGENDTGPNTGGMGAITAPDVLDSEGLARVVREVVEPTLMGARDEGFPFRGVLFVGLMLTAEGARVLEYNVRFGDPEAQAILVRLQSDLTNIFEAVARGKLGETSVEWSDEASAVVVLAARGYPSQPETGARIEGLEKAARVPSVEIFHAGTKRAEDGGWLTAGGRVLNVASHASTLDESLARCYAAVNEIHWDGMHFRRDIGRFK
ncbi:MAG: phosphoribosylamine--glycine ligase [Pyrinomonadaceae bacterium]